MMKLVKTCDACPEQYDAYQDGERVGYLRLRHGYFAVHAHGPGGTSVYEARPEGDGIFEYGERDFHLRCAVDAIQRHLRGEPQISYTTAPDVDYEVVDEDQ